MKRQKSIFTPLTHGLGKLAVACPLLTPLMGTANTIFVQPLSTGEYVLTLEKPLFFLNSGLKILQPDTLVIDGIADGLTGQGSTTARTLGETATELSLGFGQSTEAAGQEGLLDRGDFVFSAHANLPFFQEISSQSQLPRFRMIISPIEGLQGLSGEKTIFFVKDGVSTGTYPVEFVPLPLLTPTPIADPSATGAQEQGTLLLHLTGNNQDLELEFSDDLLTWSPSGIFPPTGATLDLPVLPDISEAPSIFWRLSPSYPSGNLGAAVTDLVSASGETFSMGENGRFIYSFQENGTGRFDDLEDRRTFDFTWTEISGAGYTAVTINLPSRGKQHHFLRAYNSVEGEELATLYTNYVTTYGANPTTGGEDGSEILEVVPNKIILTPTGPLLGKTWTFHSSINDFTPSEYQFISTTQVEFRVGLENPPQLVDYQYERVSENEAIFTLTIPNFADAIFEIDFVSGGNFIANYDLSSEDNFFSDRGTIRE